MHSFVFFLFSYYSKKPRSMATEFFSVVTIGNLEYLLIILITDNF